MPEKDKNKAPQNGANGQEQTLNIPKFGDKLAAGIGGATSIFDTAYDLAQTNDGYADELYRIKNQAFSPSGTYSLMNQYNNMFLGKNKGWEDFGGKTAGQYAKGILGSTATGALAGTQIAPGIGTLIGGIVGLGAGAIGTIANVIGANENEDEYNRERAENIKFAMGNFNTTNNAFKQNQYSDAIKSFYRSSAYGGLLGTHGSDFSNDIKYINVGGTHEQNPNGGVLMGYDEEGTPNLVEEGEVIFNDYVFSARLKPSKKALNDSLIGDKYLGMTYAEIAEKLAEKSEEMPNDKIEQNTLNANFKRLITIQEEQRMKKAEREANQFEGGGPLNKQEYEKRVAAIKKQFANNPEQMERLLTDALERFKQSPEYENDRLSRLVKALRDNGVYVGYGRPNKSAKQAYQDAMKSALYTDEQKDALYKAYSEIFGEEQARADTTSAYQPNTSSSTNNEQTEEQIEEQTEKQAEQVAEETVNETQSQSNSSVSATGSSNPANGSGTRTPIREGNVVRPDLTNAYVGRGQIQYDRNQNGEEFENQQYYQDFLQYMNSVKGTPEAQAWIDRINSGEFGDMNGYRINSFDDWYRLATDKKVGPVHSATLAAAQLASQPNTRERIEPILPNSKPLPNEPTLVSTLGVNPDELHDPDRPRIDTYTGPGFEGEEEPTDYSYLLRYAPVLGNALALLGNRKDYSDVHRFEGMTANPRTVRFSPIGTYIRPNLIAPSELSTPISNQMAGERNYISNNSLGNSTASNNYMLASDYLGNAKIGASYLQGKQYNSEQRQKAAAYNLGIDQFNSEGAFKEQQQNMALNNYYLQRAIYDYNMRSAIDSAYNQARSTNLTALFNNLGNIGLDTFNARRANAASPLYNQLAPGEIAYLRKMMEENSNG